MYVLQMYVLHNVRNTEASLLRNTKAVSSSGAGDGFGIT